MLVASSVDIWLGSNNKSNLAVCYWFSSREVVFGKIEMKNMKNRLPIDDNKKLKVTYRVEAGCLGPDGLNHISAFCTFAQTELQLSNADYIVWTIVHREDKTLAEIEYSLLGSVINAYKTEKYLSVFGNNLDAFESHISDHLATLIRQFMNNR